VASTPSAGSRDANAPGFCVGRTRPSTVTVPATGSGTSGVSLFDVDSGTQPRTTSTAVPSGRFSAVSTW
jgi:hypothetical protein